MAKRVSAETLDWVRRQHRALALERDVGELAELVLWGLIDRCMLQHPTRKFRAPSVTVWDLGDGLGVAWSTARDLLCEYVSDGLLVTDDGVHYTLPQAARR